MPVTLNDEETVELRALLYDLAHNAFASGEIQAMGGLRAVLSREPLAKLCVPVSENTTAELLGAMYSKEERQA